MKELFKHSNLVGTIKHFNEFDFVVIDLELQTPSEIMINAIKLLKSFNLTKPYIPPVYLDHSSVSFSLAAGFNDIGGGESTVGHAGFSETTKMDIHVDGTLESIGEVGVSVLICLESARNGGETFLVRTSRLAEGIEIRKRPIFEPLFSPVALRRHITLKGRQTYRDGPVFASREGRIIGRYCDTPRDEWMFEKVEGLKRSKLEFDKLILESTHLTHTLKLQPGQMLIMKNSRVAHGRNSYENSSVSHRHLVRSLYTNASLVLDK